MQKGSKIQVRTFDRIFQGSEFDAKVARACILYEDIKVEAQGFSLEKIPELSSSDEGKVPSLYFLRQACETMVKAGELLVELNGDSYFENSVRPTLHEDGLDGWNEAVEFVGSEDFEKIKALLQAVSPEGLQMVLATVKDRATGSLELAFESGMATDLHCHFVGELVRKALVPQQEGPFDENYQELKEFLENAQEGLIFAFQVLIGACVVPKFGF